MPSDVNDDLPRTERPDCLSSKTRPVTTHAHPHPLPQAKPQRLGHVDKSVESVELEAERQSSSSSDSEYSEGETNDAEDCRDLPSLLATPGGGGSHGGEVGNDENDVDDETLLADNDVETSPPSPSPSPSPHSPSPSSSVLVTLREASTAFLDGSGARAHGAHLLCDLDSFTDHIGAVGR